MLRAKICLWMVTLVGLVDYGVGSRMKLAYTRAMITAALKWRSE